MSSYVEDTGMAESGVSTTAEGMSKTQSFVDRMDLAVTEFLQKSKSQIAVNTPQSIESNFRFFTQRFKERMGSNKVPGVHITSQPEVDEAAKEVTMMHLYFDELSKLVERQLAQLKALNETEQELALFFQQKGYQEKIEEISAMSIDIGKAYSDGVKTRSAVITAVDGFNEFVKTFKDKAIQDSIDTMKRQENARVEFDSYAGKLEYLQRPSNTTILGKEHTSPDPATLSAADKEVEHAKNQFQGAKLKYQNLSTAIIDKAVLLEMKRDVDYRTQLERLVKVRGALAGCGLGDAGGSGGVGVVAGSVVAATANGDATSGSKLVNGGAEHEESLYGASPFSQGAGASGVAAYQVPMSD